MIDKANIFPRTKQDQNLSQNWKVKYGSKLMLARNEKVAR